MSSPAAAFVEEGAAHSLPPPTLGVFDSGVGGLTVLQALRARMPNVALHYLADAGHAPYGDRSSDYIRARSLRVAEHLRAAGARMVVVACNTATAHAVNAMRERWADWPVVGIEPGVKPAVAATRNGRIGVMATTATIASRRYEALVAAHAAEVSLVSQPCPGLVTLIERGDLDTPELGALIDRYCEPLKAAGVDTVLLGCTHYPLVQARIQAALGNEVRLLNIEDAVARQAQRLWEALEVPGHSDGHSLGHSHAHSHAQVPAHSDAQARSEAPNLAPGQWPATQLANPAQRPAPLVLQSTGDPGPLQHLARVALGWKDAEATHIDV